MTLLKVQLNLNRYFDFGPIDNKRCQTWRPCAESSNFSPFSVNNLFNFSTQGQDLAPFLAMEPIYFLRLSHLQKDFTHKAGHPSKLFIKLAYYNCRLRCNYFGFLLRDQLSFFLQHFFLSKTLLANTCSNYLVLAHNTKKMQKNSFIVKKN